MAMTKKEREQFDAMVDELRLKAALRWTEPVEPDLPPPEDSGELTLGYLPSGSQTDYPTVTEACSSSVYHGRDHKKTSTQGARHLYSTRLLALKATRHLVELDCAARLAKVDRQIEQIAARL